ncbi:MAG: hypothetical protein IID59_00865 [Proteobacteria bacterium]|nr:hypothetical protein [Pseudomonadota bacterium]
MQMNASISLLLCMTLLFGCASQEEDQQSARELSRESEKEVRMYLDKAMLAELPFIHFRDSLRWKYLNDYFVTVEANDGDHLIEMNTECVDLRAKIFYTDMVDRRSKRDIIRARRDTIRGCRIKMIYVLPESDGLPEPTKEPNAPP